MGAQLCAAGLILIHLQTCADLDLCYQRRYCRGVTSRRLRHERINKGNRCAAHAERSLSSCSLLLLAVELILVAQKMFELLTCFSFCSGCSQLLQYYAIGDTNPATLDMHLLRFKACDGTMLGS
jgi:hypothetical protein